MENDMTTAEVKNGSPRWMTVEEFKRRYGVAHTKTYRLFKQGAVRPFKVGRSTRINFDEAEAWAARLEAGSIYDRQEATLETAGGTSKGRVS